MSINAEPGARNDDPKSIENLDGLGELTPTLISTQPQVTRHPADPLNWPKWKKGLVVGHVSAFYFLFTFLTTVTVPTFADLQEIYHATYAQINYTVAVPALALGLSPFMWSPLADTFGRRIVMIFGCLVAFVATIASAVAKSYSGYMVARFLQGWGVGPASSVGLQMLLDVYFEHERGQKVGYWTLAIDTGLLFGPLIGGFAALVSTEFVAWLTAILFGTLLVSMVVLLPETAFPRHKVLEEEEALRNTHPNSSFSTPNESIFRPTPFLNFRPITGLRSSRPWDTALRFVRMFAYPNIVVSIMFYCWSWYWFILCVITMLPAAYPNYKPHIQGLLFLGLIIGTVVAEIFFSGSLSDRMVDRLSKSGRRPRTPEMRLWLFWPAAMLTAIGLVLFGLTIQYNWHWAIGQVATGIFAFGVQVGNTITTTYAVDCHPEHVMDVIVFYSFHLNLSAFASPFFIVPWVSLAGWAWSFGAQGLIVAVCAIVAVGFLQTYGQRVRERCGPLPWPPAA
ncbi:hypothetical protein FRB99_007606 [Tulasnella sp. 403]|nr:hypothetical protein FRB99_007606 [Tulasnella sp. 403]